MGCACSAVVSARAGNAPIGRQNGDDEMPDGWIDENGVNWGKEVVMHDLLLELQRWKDAAVRIFNDEALDEDIALVEAQIKARVSGGMVDTPHLK
jgi:hypothetical protein